MSRRVLTLDGAPVAHRPTLDLRELCAFIGVNARRPECEVGTELACTVGRAIEDAKDMGATMADLTEFCPVERLRQVASWRAGLTLPNGGAM